MWLTHLLLSHHPGKTTNKYIRRSAQRSSPLSANAFIEERYPPANIENVFSCRRHRSSLCPSAWSDRHLATLSGVAVLRDAAVGGLKKKTLAWHLATMFITTIMNQLTVQFNFKQERPFWHFDFKMKFVCFSFKSLKRAILIFPVIRTVWQSIAGPHIVTDNNLSHV